MRPLKSIKMAGARIWKDRRGQDLLEYAMIAGFLAVVSGMFMPNVSQDVSMLYSKIASTMTKSVAAS